MKVSGITITAALALLLILPASAQEGRRRQLLTGGLMADKDIVSPSELFELSQTQFNFGTARSMAMAGAFTSLGADLSSMSINPAGLGMYRRNEVSITPLMTFARADNNAAAWEKNSRNRFSLGNIGVVFNAYEGTRGLISLNLGFGYNRLADLNYRSSFYQTGNIGSIADMYAKQMQYSGMNANQIQGNNLNWGSVSTQLWPAVLGYKIAMIDDPGNNGDWSPTWIGDRFDPATGAHHIDIGQYSTVQSSGSIGEYTFSVGANIGNKVYIGATLGVQSLYQKKEYFYAEDYVYPNGATTQKPEGVAPDLDYQLLDSKMNQAVIVDGTGVNFKLGVTYRPIDNLRVGVAFHTPTYYSFTRKYQAAAASLSYVNRASNPDVDADTGDYLPLTAETPLLVDDGSNNWSFISPSRLLLGASYTFGQRGVISVDYERAWYNGIRMKDTPGGIAAEDYNHEFRTSFKGANTLRIGAEFKPVPVISLRAGFGYSGSWLQNEDAQLQSPIARQIVYYGAGIGFALSRSVVLDFAYSYQSNKMTTYTLYYADEYVDENGQWVLDGVNASDDFKTTINRHSVAVTLGFRF